MSQSYIYPGSVDTFVPSLTSDLVVEFSLNPDRFPAVQYIDYRMVGEPKGYYISMLNDGQDRVINSTDNVWADGSERPWQDITDSFTFPQFLCIRHSQGRRIGYVAVDNAGWDIVDQASRFAAQQLMTARVYRIHQTLTTQANWSWGIGGGNSNYATATTAGGGPWANSTSSDTYIRSSLMYAANKIKLATNNVVQQGDLICVINPNTAQILASSGEYLSFVAQNTASIQIWEGQQQFATYGLPENLMGFRLIVDGTTYNSAGPGVTASQDFTLPDDYAVIVSKPRGISPSASSSFSTFSVFVYQDQMVEVFEDPKNRRVELSVSEYVDTSSNALVAAQSGYLLDIAS